MTTVVSMREKDILDWRQDLSIDELVQQASRVIAPLWPLQTFAARSPWMDLEDETFQTVAERFLSHHQIDLYPSIEALRKAIEDGKIHDNEIKKRLKAWLNEHPHSMEPTLSWAYCREALRLKPIPSSLVKKAHELLKHTKPTKKQALSSLINQPPRLISHVLSEEEGIKEPALLLEHQMIKWCKLFMNQSNSLWSIPFQDEGFYKAWKHLVVKDTSLPKAVRNHVALSSEDPSEVIRQSLKTLAISPEDVSSYLESHFIQLPGWAGAIKWIVLQNKEEEHLLLDYIAIRLSLEVALVKPYLNKRKSKRRHAPSLAEYLAAWAYYSHEDLNHWMSMSHSEQKARIDLVKHFSLTVQKQLLLEAWEWTYETQLKNVLIHKKTVNHANYSASKPQAQLAFCIDVRSEPFRRHLEQSGPFETFGIAGFFGLPIEKQDWTGHVHPSLPVILKPKHRVVETLDSEKESWFLSKRDTKRSYQNVFKKFKNGLMTSLLLPDLSGLWMGIHLGLRAFFPRLTGTVRRHLFKSRNKWLQTHLQLDAPSTNGEDGSNGLTREEQVTYVHEALKSMGLTRSFAPLIVFCGHASISTNNPFAASLDCGACGGASGGFNARVLAECANRSEVRQALVERGVTLPSSTKFAAAEHITTTDEWKWVYVPELSEQGEAAFNALNKQLPFVQKKTNEERLAHLGYKGFVKKAHHVTHQFKEDWSEIRPEWGLAKNASFIIGRRELTQMTDLKGRAFLHSYDWTQDPDGTILTKLLAGPGTVAQWINLQYYASAVSPHVYGSGSKTTQTVTSGFGVMQGNGSDLQQGLPLQSINLSEDETYHEPLRLLVVIEAPKELVEKVLQHLLPFKQKVQNGWLRLAVLTPEGHWISLS